MSSETAPADDDQEVAGARWRIDPSRSLVEFQVPHFYGLMTVKGRFERYVGTLDIAASPAVELVIDASSVETKQRQRDKHLRSDDFFDVANHPEIRFASDSATLDGGRLVVRGRLDAAGGSVPLELEARLRRDGGEFEVETSTAVDQRALGMTWSPFGLTRAPSRLIVKGRLVKDV